jgi:hypothetical protein
MCLYVEPIFTFVFIEHKQPLHITLQIYCTGISLNIHHTKKNFNKDSIMLMQFEHHAGRQFLRQSIL